MRTTRLSWALLLASALTLATAVAVLAPSEDLAPRTSAPNVVPRNVTPARLAPSVALDELPSRVVPRRRLQQKLWPFPTFDRADPVRMILY